MPNFKKWPYLVITLLMFFIADINFINATYETKNNKVYYYEHEITEANSTTFQQLNVYWAKDNAHIYNKWQIVGGADPETFEVIDYELGKDKNNVYWNSQYFNETHIIKNADPKTFKILSSSQSPYGFAGSGDNHYTEDKENIFYIGMNTIDNQKMIGVDKTTFSIIDWKYSKDKNNVYHENSIVIDADPSSFQIIKGNVKDYAIDNNYVYCDGKKLNNSDSKTLEILDSYNAKDKNNIYTNSIDGCQLVSNNSGTYQILNRNYEKDADNVYFFHQIIKGADPATFKVIQDIYGVDKNHAYYMFDIIEGADPATFQYLDHGYGKDSKNVFYQRNIIEGVDLVSFKTTKDNYAVDNFSTYYENIIKTRIKKINNKKSYNNLKGRIILQVENNGEAYYVNPRTEEINFLSRPETAFEVMRSQGVGITNADLEKIPVADNYCPKYNLNCDSKNKYNKNFAEKQKGKIFLQTEKNGEAWYINPADNKRYFLGRPQDAFNIMKKLGLGISNKDFNNLY